ncbi:hypothetical protein ALC57_04734 [Trachymyrmex cornetzi]|uniref:Uncharacterized protein n=1 Tax=Trachymyrmex cornetzi TaxID=471704 RepID=A0A195ECW2_9HYME|nr:hypothetical protein ALC57_04734 [Trachymyrmex cornetzi]
MSGEKGYPSTCAASSSAKRRDEIPRKLEITQNLHFVIHVVSCNLKIRFARAGTTSILII